MVKVLLDWTISCIAWLVWDNGQIRWESSEECLVGMVLVRQSMKARYEILMWDGRFKKQMFILNFSYEVLIYCWPKNWTANLFLYIFWPSVKILGVPFWKFRFKTGLLIGSNAGMLLPNLWPDMWPFFVLLYTYSKKFIYKYTTKKEIFFVKQRVTTLLLMFTSHLMLAGAGLMLRARESLADSSRTSRGSWLLPCRGGTTTSDQAVGSLTTSFTTAATP